MKRLTRATVLLRDRSGLALPLALIGLVAVSLLITTAIVTSSNEVALSFGHQRGAKGLYRADEALERYVADRAGMAWNVNDQRFKTGSSPVQLADGSVYNIQVAELSRQRTTDPSGNMTRTEVFSAVASPSSGRGRSIGALLRATRTAPPVALNINSGLTLGVNTTVSGNATISDGSDGGAGCSPDSAAEHAIVYGSDNTLAVDGSANIVGTTQQDTLSGADLIAQVFNGMTIDELVTYANIRFGPAYGQPKFENSKKPNSAHAEFKYRWGCPEALMEQQLLASCPAGTAEYHPVVAIDAAGGTVDISGDHGQGTLIVRNGTLRIRGNFLYGGIIISEGATHISGTPIIEGAVITVGSETTIDPDAALASGASVVRYNRCAVIQSQAGLSAGSLSQREQVVSDGTWGWFEVVR
jgi:hypothetical protein